MSPAVAGSVPTEGAVSKLPASPVSAAVPPAADAEAATGVAADAGTAATGAVGAAVPFAFESVCPFGRSEPCGGFSLSDCSCALPNLSRSAPSAVSSISPAHHGTPDDSSLQRDHQPDARYLHNIAQ